MLSMIPSALNGVNPKDLEKIKTLCRTAFPSVKQITTEELAEWLETPQQSTLLVDVRSPEEFAVSRLRGAANLRSAGAISQAISEQQASKTILYCSVGFRSSRIAQHLTSGIGSGVFNLEGSIFEWANEGRPVYRDEVEVRQVHPYADRWVGLLKPGLAGRCESS
jgi:rhodanese-related sulfurtransferase